MLSVKENTKFCWLCAKDVMLEHCTVDENGLCVHRSCIDKRTMLEAASAQVERWRHAQSHREAA